MSGVWAHHVRPYIGNLENGGIFMEYVLVTQGLSKQELKEFSDRLKG